MHQTRDLSLFQYGIALFTNQPPQPMSASARRPQPISSVPGPSLTSDLYPHVHAGDTSAQHLLRGKQARDEQGATVPGHCDFELVQQGDDVGPSVSRGARGRLEDEREVLQTHHTCGGGHEGGGAPESGPGIIYRVCLRLQVGLCLFV